MKGVKSLFAHDTEFALVSTAALINTQQPETDELDDLAALDLFVQSWGWTGSRSHDKAELDSVRALRPRLRQLWYLGEDEAVVVVNGLLVEGQALPQLVKHGSWNYHLHATSSDAPLADRMAVEAAMAMVDVLRQQELGRLRLCAATGCEDVFIDLSKNRTRRFCNSTCGNRTNVAAFRARQASSTAG